MEVIDLNIHGQMWAVSENRGLGHPNGHLDGEHEHDEPLDVGMPYPRLRQSPQNN